MRDQTELTDEFRPGGFFVFRTPLLPFSTLLEWANGVQVSPDLSDFSLIRKELARRLRQIVSRPEVGEALYIASPAMYSELARWLGSEDRPDPKLERTLAKYVQRIASRCTPFGLFAGLSVGYIGDETTLQIDGVCTYQRHCRLDNAYLFALLMHAAGLESLADRMSYAPNSSLCHLGGRWRYVQAITGRNEWHYELVALDGDEFLDWALNHAKAGVTQQSLAEALVASDPSGEITSEDAIVFVKQLIDWQVLMPEMTPSITGDEPSIEALRQLTRLAPSHLVTATLERVLAQLTKLEAARLPGEIAAYKQVEQTLSALPIPIDPSRLFQVDMTKPAPRATLGRPMVEQIGRAVVVLQRLAPSLPTESLRRFREEFLARYDRREVPLLETLDEEIGIGFERSSSAAAENAPLLRGIKLSNARVTPNAGWMERDAFLLERVLALTSRGAVLELQKADIEKLSRRDALPLPNAFSVFAQIAGTAGGEPLLLIRHVSGPSGAAILGRFCHADSALCAAVKSYLRAEEERQPEAIFAEVVHLPDGRLGNIAARPVLRRFEIPYLGRSGASDDCQIPLSDLTVSVRNEEIVLRSKRLGAQVIPRMTNAHNYSRGQGAYRFLCALQAQGVSPWLAWNWGPLESLPYLPRVAFERTVFARARWRLGATLLKRFSTGSATEQYSAVIKWVDKEQVPRHCVVVEGDNELHVDFENALSIETFIHLTKKREMCIVAEMFPTPANLCASGPEGQFSHELIVPFINTAKSAMAPPPSERSAAVMVVRSFPPGSAWIYLKIYAGTSTVDQILSVTLAPFIREQLAGNAIDRWFFVRYSDPEWHLRVRLHAASLKRAELMVAIDRLSAELMKSGQAWKVQFDTYEREIERYGGEEGIALCEEMFWHDSEFAIDTLRVMVGNEGLLGRSELCLRWWDEILSALGFTLKSKYDLISETRQGFVRLMGADKSVEHQLGSAFRSARKRIEAMFDGSPEGLHSPAVGHVEHRRRLIMSTGKRLREAADAGVLQNSLDSIASALLHMSANRLLRSAHREQELVLHDFLKRLYRSRVARQGN